MDIAHRQEQSGEEEPLHTEKEDTSRIKGHLNRVSELVVQFPSELSFYRPEEWRKWGKLIGLWHDVGKYSREFQCYIRSKIQGRYNHSTAGALHAVHQFPVSGDLMAYAIAGHHGGMPNGTDLFGERMKEDIPEWEKYVPKSVLNAGCEKLFPLVRFSSQEEMHRSLGFSLAMQVRMLFSCLVDADFLATEAFMNPVRSKERACWPENILERMSAVLEEYLSNKEQEARTVQEISGNISDLRARIHKRCLEQGEKLPRGVYRLDVPTGGGKTLSSLSFALKHACTRHLNRVIYVIPYTSIIDQTAEEFRKVFTDLSAELGEECVLTHHSGLAPELDSDTIRLMSENWDAPLIVTTGVQLFESLFSNKPSRCRKVHRCGNAVLVFDEAQTLPSGLLSPCLEAMKCMNRDYGSTLVLCTATQPSFERNDDFPIGWKQEDVQSLLGETLERELKTNMRRVKVVRLPEHLSCSELVTHYGAAKERSSVLMIVNTTRHAQELYKSMRAVADDDSLYHLSARMVPKHRTLVLDDVRERLKEGKRVVLIATRVVEAGVDLSFPVVYRAQAGLDSLAQAAGRCNRHGEFSEGGTVYSFESADFPIPSRLKDMEAASTATRDVWKKGCDVFDDKVISSFFQLYYDNRKIQTNTWDECRVSSKCKVNMNSLNGFRTIQFKDLAEQFHMIPPGQREVVLVFGDEQEYILKELKKLESLPEFSRYPNRELRRKIAQYTIQVYDNEYNIMRQKGIMESYAEGSVEVVTDMKNVYDMNIGFLPMADYDSLHCN